jgi:hypothetical protein
MTYSINLTNGTSLIPGGLLNGIIDQTATDLTLIGQNATGYGLYINDNFVHLLENFANTSQPPNPIKGQLWYDTTQNLLQVYNGSAFQPTGNTIVASSAPSSLASGGLWVNSATSQLWFNDGLETVLAGPIYTKAQGQSGFSVSSVVDTVGVGHTIVSLNVGGTLLGIFAKEAFVPASSIAGFTSTSVVVGTQSGTTLTVTTVVNGTLSVGQTITGVGITPGTMITGFGSGSGGIGTYLVSTSATVSSTTITAISGSIGIGFNASTFAGIEFNVPVSQANSLIAPDGTLKTTTSFVSTTDSSATSGTLSIQNATPLILGTAGYTQFNVNYTLCQIQSKISNQNFEISTLSGSTNSPAIHINATTDSVGVFTASPQATLDVNGTLRVTPATPASSSATGVAGQIAWDASYIYVCTATNTWKRASLSTW